MVYLPAQLHASHNDQHHLAEQAIELCPDIHTCSNIKQGGDKNGKPCPSMIMMCPIILPSMCNIPDDTELCLKVERSLLGGPSKRLKFSDFANRLTQTADSNQLCSLA